MAGLDFFGSSTASTHTHPRSAPAAAAASASGARSAAGVVRKNVANASLRNAAVTAAAGSGARSSTAASPASPSRAHTPSSTSSPRSASAATSRPSAVRHLNHKIASPSPAASPSPSTVPSHRPSVVVVRTVTTKAKTTSSSSLSRASGAGTASSSSTSFKYNALPEERRLRIAHEREQREREQAEKEHAERRGNVASAAAGEAAANDLRPLKKRRTASSASENKQRGSPSSSQASSSATKRKPRPRTTKLSSDDDDDAKDDDAFLHDLSSSRSGNSLSKEEWVYPPRQPRDVVRQDEKAAVKEAKASAKREDGKPRQQRTHTSTTGIDNPTRPLIRATSSMDVVTQAGLKNFAPYFRDIDDLTLIQLEYPAMHASESFPLLVPRPLDEYDPLSDLLRTIHVMVSSYFPDEALRTRLFGRLEELEPSTGSRLLPRDAASPLGVASTLSGQVTPVGGAVAALHASTSLSPLTTTAYPSGASTPVRLAAHGGQLADGTGAVGPMSSSALRLTTSDRLATPQPTTAIADAPTPLSTPGPTTTTTTPSESILRSFQRARNRRNGPLFVRTVARFNETMRAAKREGVVLDGVRRMSEVGIPERLWTTIHDQCYSRVVGPKVELLNDYQAFSDNVYGELLPRFSSEIAHLTGLGPSSVFVDMGSGVGNVIVQLALQTGCSAYGCEMMDTPASLASAQIEEARARWAMWGLRGGEVEAWKDNFCTDERVREVLLRADVVLVNNYAFTPATNDKLVLQFLDLKDGCHIISLKPFVPPDFRLTERTLSSPLAILRVVERTYSSGSVSWASGGGRYYVHTVDRRIVQDFRPSKTTRGETRTRRWKKNVEEDDDDMMSM
ncbi:unnamed protein product [Tilletia controversa]|uniref:Histone-lysine N-methyltransferase, H3 lysine-79 specific n=3 Tax=Tilletia TaxID=13289 RepID=A0A8X7MKU4_9BASI|nr:hypothetical protein CF336_g7997 [Tilletia laevis]KAE8185205.1 hypothetical protein CF328_g7615 [Tilletia controversa]KAE8245307.1 hypothetical protein A4X03_0g7474 [Tilletia caries]KAE8194839.1 hypothetical protein CF335_g5238 [Tilletia laevis]KAE8239666.1 hypothetical protein A4X06_0g8120 [Tilletia controversa]